MRRPQIFPAHSRPNSTAFTLLEIMVALGIMAVGMTAALGLLTAATTTGRRAENYVQTALAADIAFSEIQSKLTFQFDHKELPTLSPEDRLKLVPPESNSSAAEDPMASTEDTATDPTSATGPFVVISPENPLPGYEDFQIWGLITPVIPTVTNSAQPDQEHPRAYLAEVHVLWSFKGRRRSAVFHTLLLRRLKFSDLPRRS